MTYPGAELLAFVNQVRAVQGLDPLRYVVMLDADVDSEDACILARALGVPIGGSLDPAWSSDSRWVMRFSDPWTARTVAERTRQEWLPDRLEVALPDLLIDFATAAHFGFVEGDDAGLVRAWLVPRDRDDMSRGFVRRWLPNMWRASADCASSRLQAEGARLAEDLAA